MRPHDVSAVVCTMNSIKSIRRCLESLRRAGVGEVLVVDAQSIDGTREVAEEFADRVLTDSGQGLGQARNLGIEGTRLPLILNMGSDNVMPQDQLPILIRDLLDNRHRGVSARTLVEGNGFVAEGMNAWRTARFSPGPAPIIGTPSLFEGDLLRASPYDPSRRYSDDSELCERWVRDFQATFGISSAYVLEIGKATWPEVVLRCQMYGSSDAEIYRHGCMNGWSARRKVQSLLHPLRVDFVSPLRKSSWEKKFANAPFLLMFSLMRYFYWLTSKAGR